jgi:hypothetical protein
MLRKTLLLAWSACALAAQDQRYEAILARHKRSLGDAAGLRSKNLYSLRTLRNERGQVVRVRSLVRARPFGFRQEAMPIEPTGPGFVRVTDGRHAWLSPGLMPDLVAVGAPLQSRAAMMLLEQAFVEGFLYLDRERIPPVANPPILWTLPPWPGLPEGFAQQPKVQTVPYRTPAGSMLQLHFDLEDGRLHEVSQTDVLPHWRLRYGAWKEYGGFHLPSVRAVTFPGAGGAYVEERSTLDELRVVDSHPEIFFAGNPAQSLPAEQPAGTLLVLPDTLPGSGVLVLDEVSVNRSQPVRALLDLGATDSAIEVGLADALRLPQAGTGAHSGMHATREDFVHRFIDEITFGQRRVLQVPRAAIPLPLILALHADRRPGLLLGNTELLADSPVFDLRRGLLYLRAAPAIPLAEVGRRRLPVLEPGRVIEIAAAEPRRGRQQIQVPVTIGGKVLTALIDTGLPPILRLQGTGLARLDWPARSDKWLERGALPVPTWSGPGLANDLAVQIDELRLGGVVYQRPWVLIADPKVPEAVKSDAILGCGAFLPFRRFGWNDGKQVVEVEWAEAEGEMVVPCAGTFLGMTIASGSAKPAKEVEALPLVLHVAEGSAAARAGVRAGERVKTIDGVECGRIELRERLRKLWGAGLRLTLMDGIGGKQREVRVGRE